MIIDDDKCDNRLVNIITCFISLTIVLISRFIYLLNVVRRRILLPIKIEHIGIFEN